MSAASTLSARHVPTAPAADPAPARSGLDWPLLGIAVVLACVGLLMITSASSLDADARYGNALHFAGRQGVALVAGLVCAGLVLRAPWAWIRGSVWPVYAASLVALALVMTPLGHSANGATRWISMGPVNIQPSEFAKLAVIVVLAHFLACNRGRLEDFVGVVLPALSLVVPVLVLVMFQKDFGTTVILTGLAGTLLFLAGLQWRYLFGLGAAAAGALALMIVVEPYRIRRLVSFLDPFADPDGAGYQVVQGWIALATGGLTGSGLASGVAQRGFLPEAHTDFISAVVGEELGAVGFAVMVLLLMGLVWRGLHIASRAPDLFGMLLASGIAVMFAAQAAINIGVVVGMMPAKGLVLPFLSYGSSAALCHTLCVGLLLRVSMEPAPAASGPDRAAATSGG